MKRRMHFLWQTVSVVVLIAALSGCTAAIPTAAPAESSATQALEASVEEMSPEMQTLVAAAQAEGELTTIALPATGATMAKQSTASRQSTGSTSTSWIPMPALATNCRPSRPTRTI